MSREAIKIVMTVAALGCCVAGATFARSNIANLAGGQAMAKAEVDRPVTETTAMARHDDMPALMTMIDFYHASGNATGTPRPEGTATVGSSVDFDYAFSTTAMSRRENTPPNREKLRDAGWQRILGPR